MKSSSAFVLFSYLANHSLINPTLHLVHITSTARRLNMVDEKHKSTLPRTQKEPSASWCSPLPFSPYLFSSNFQNFLLHHCPQVRSFFLYNGENRSGQKRISRLPFYIFNLLAFAPVNSAFSELSVFLSNSDSYTCALDHIHQQFFPLFPKSPNFLPHLDYFQHHTSM